MVVQSFTKKSLKNIPQALILLKVYFFFLIWNFFREAIKNVYVGVLLLKKHNI